MDENDVLSELNLTKKKKSKKLSEEIKQLDINDKPKVKLSETGNIEEELNLGLKKKSKKASVNLDPDTQDKPSDGKLIAEELNLGEKKKKKKSVKPPTEEKKETVDDVSKVADAAGYSYDALLKRIFDQIQANNPEFVSDKKNQLIMEPPQLARIGSKKTSFVNFPKACASLHRDASHLSTYIFAELGTSGSVDGNGALIIRGRYQVKHIEPILLSYCRTYVKCATCQSPKTKLEKDSRLLFVHCQHCNSKITVKNVSSGFQAVTSKRSNLRAKAV